VLNPARLLAAGAASALLLATVPAQADETPTPTPSDPATPTTTATTGASPTETAEPAETADHPGAPGNNGTVKIADYTDLDEQRPENDPHVPCTFAVEWFNFDSGWGPLTAQVEMRLHAPTDESAGVAMTVEGNQAPTFTGNGGQPGAGDGRDHIEWYTLSFTGEPHPEQGYHVKVVVDTPHSKGSTRKSKVFWVEPCTDEAPTPSEIPAPSTEPTTSISAAPETVAPSESADTPSGEPTVQGTEAVAPPAGDDSPSDEPTVLGAEAQASPAAAVPSAVAAGLPGVIDVVQAKATSPAGAFLVTAGLLLVGTAVVAAVRRRRGAHQV
jgi:hypothetical protein